MVKRIFTLLKPGDRPTRTVPRAKTRPHLAITIRRFPKGSNLNEDLLTLQQTIGNKAVGSLLAKDNHHSVRQVNKLSIIGDHAAVQRVSGSWAEDEALSEKEPQEEQLPPAPPNIYGQKDRGQGKESNSFFGSMKKKLRSLIGGDEKPLKARKALTEPTPSFSGKNIPWGPVVIPNEEQESQE